MATDFSWSDGIQAAFSFCLPCLRPTHSETGPDDNNDDDEDELDNNSYGNGTRGVRRARPNELEGLLADVRDSNTSDTEAETLSLHSNIGSSGADRRRRTRHRRGLKKRITLFGWNLFGRPPIQLPDDEEEQDELLRRSRRWRRRPTNTATLLTSSTSTLDSDAAPLDPAAIQNLQISYAQLDVRAAAAEAEDKRLKEERRHLRKERKELQRVARALAEAAEAGRGAEGGYEGFLGSGGGGGGGAYEYQHMPSSSFQGVQSPPQSGTSDGGFGGITAFLKGQPSNGEPDSDDADLGGQQYARKTTSRSSNSSDSRSRTSASQSNPDPSAHHYLNSQPLSHMVPPLRSDSMTTSSDPPQKNKKTKSSKSKSKASSASHSSNRSSSISQSPSLQSPVGTSFPVSPGVVLPHSPLSLSRHREELEGFPVDSGESLGFPSPAIGGIRTKGRDMGAFLADRGNA